MGRYKLYDLERDNTLELELTASQFEELKRFIKGLKNPPEMDYKYILEQYNSICRKLPPATRLTDKRKRAIARLLKDGYDLTELFQAASQSPFLSGANKQQWHASLDWLLIPSNALKVLEGNYSPLAPKPSAPMTGNPFEEYG